MIEFDAFFRRVVGRPPPAVLYFAQGAQFAASRAALRSTPKASGDFFFVFVCFVYLDSTEIAGPGWCTPDMPPRRPPGTTDKRTGTQLTIPKRNTKARSSY